MYGNFYHCGGEGHRQTVCPRKADGSLDLTLRGALATLTMIARRENWKDDSEIVEVARGQRKVLRNYSDIKDSVNAIRAVF